MGSVPVLQGHVNKIRRYYINLTDQKPLDRALAGQLRVKRQHCHVVSSES